MNDLMRALLGAPVAMLLILAGLVFLLLAVVGNISGKIEPGPKGRIASAALGVILLAGGLGLHFAERSQSTGDTTTVENAQHAPEAQAAPTNDVSPADVVDPAAPSQRQPQALNVGDASDSTAEQRQEREVNDHITQANAIAVGGSVLGKISTPKDRDIFKFVAPGDAMRVILRKGTIEGFATEVDIYDQSESRVARSVTFGDTPSTIGFQSTEGGTYYIFVKSQSGSRGPYELIARRE